MEKTITIGGISLRCQVSEESEANGTSCQFRESGICEECTCSECSNGMIVRRAADGVVWSRPCRCRDLAVQRMRLRKAGLEEISQRCRLDNFEAKASWQQAMMDVATKYVAERAWTKGRGMMFTGTSGSGKTHLCVAVLAEMVRLGVRPQYIRWVPFSTRVKALTTSAEEYDRATSPYVRAEALLLDDLLKNDPSPADLKLLFEIVDERVSAARPTIISSERSLAEVSAMWGGAGEAISGRFAEHCGEYLIEIAPGPGRNHRLTI